MQGADLLLVGTEVSVAFAGFAGIIATFQAKGEKHISRGDLVGLDIVVNFGPGWCLLLGSTTRAISVWNPRNQRLVFQ